MRKCASLFIKPGYHSLNCAVNRYQINYDNNNSDNNDKIDFIKHFNETRMELSEDNALKFAFLQGFKGMMLEHKGSAHAVHKFYNDFFQMGYFDERNMRDVNYCHKFVTQVMTQFGYKLVMHLCRCNGGMLSWEQKSSIVKLFKNWYTFANNYFEILSTNELNKLAIETPSPTKQEFVANFF